MTDTHDIVIIGAGAAGLTAGIYAARANMNTLLVEKFVPGGQAALTAFVENYPGFPDGVSGYDLMDGMRRQALAFGLETTTTEVTGIERTDFGFRLGTSIGDIATRTIIIATGVRPRKLGVPGEQELFGKGVSTCATCDGAFYRDREVAVIGGGDSAMDEGIFLTRFASRVHIIHRRDAFRALPSLVEKARANEKITFHLDTVVSSINGSDSVTGLTIRNVKTGDVTDLPTEGVFLYVGLIPNAELFRGFLEMDDNGFIVVDNSLMTTVPGVFVAGDVRTTPLRQIITAAADGAVAAHAAGVYIEEHD